MKISFRAIIDGTFSPGERLMKSTADEIRSATSVRSYPCWNWWKAVNDPQAVPGTYVARYFIKDINEVYEIRTSLDVLARVFFAAERHRDVELETAKTWLLNRNPFLLKK